MHVVSITNKVVNIKSRVNMFEVTIGVNGVATNLFINLNVERMYLDPHRCLQDLPKEMSPSPAQPRMSQFSGS
jgi:hypothetical protein